MFDRDEYDRSRGFDDEWCDLIREHIVPRYVRVVPSSREEDMNRAADLRVFTVPELTGMRIATRTRRPYAAQWPHEFTITYTHPTGGKAEWSKIMDEGWGTFMGYGHTDPDDEHLAAWAFIDLDVLRAIPDLRSRGTQKRNPHNGDTFLIFDGRHLPGAPVIASSADAPVVGPGQEVMF